MRPCRVMGSSPTAVLFTDREAVLLTPFRAGSTHVVQLGTIRVENARDPYRERRAETLSHLAREGADDRQLT